MQYGVNALGTVKGVIDTSSFVANNIPTQVKSIQGVTSKLIDYAKTNKIATPSNEEIAAAAKNMEKE